MVVSALISGDRPIFAIERILTGSVVVAGPETKLLMMTSSRDRVNEINAVSYTHLTLPTILRV